VSAFRFRAQRLLELRRTQADAARAAMARAHEAARVTESSVAAADAHCARARDAFRTEAAGATSVAVIEQHRAWIGRLEMELQQHRRVHEQRLGELARTVESLAQATRAVRVLERLRERNWRRHVEAGRLAEIKMLDEIATGAYARRREGRADRGH
jgi:flagellar protein FliJ